MLTSNCRFSKPCRLRDPSPWRGALKGGQWHQPLLPNEPRIAHPALEQRLTDTYLLPVMAAFEALLWEVRVGLDPELQARKPVKLGKPFPSSQCLEIAQAFYARLRTLRAEDVSAASAPGLAALRRFQKAGGSFRRVWGDLRGQYFQNAFQVGTLYVDVANDTVTPTKPKIEVLPFTQANFHPIRDAFHYVRVASAYWGGEFYPNHLFPDLAPHCPILWKRPGGQLMVLAYSQYMLALSHREQFETSRSFLAQEALCASVFRTVSEGLSGGSVASSSGAGPTVAANRDYRDVLAAMAKSPEEGRKEALQRCQSLRKRLRHWKAEQTTEVIERVTQINLQLAAIALAKRERPVVTINGRAYELEQLSDQARQQLDMVLACDTKLRALEQELLLAQTARNTYAGALKVALAAATSV